MDYGVGGSRLDGDVCDPLGSARLTANHLAPTQVRPLSPPPPTLYIFAAVSFTISVLRYPAPLLLKARRVLQQVTSWDRDNTAPPPFTHPKG